MKTLVNASTAVIMIVSLLMMACDKNSAQSQTETQVVQGQAVSDEVTTVTPKLDIHSATYLGDLKSVRQHIKAGTDLDKKDQYGSTPLIIAIIFDKTAVAEALVEAGADLSVGNNDGSTPLHIAAFFCKTEVVNMLLKNGADKTLINNYGSTPRETVAGPFDQVKPIYDQIDGSLKPLGLNLDYEYLEATRPEIADLLL